MTNAIQTATTLARRDETRDRTGFIEGATPKKSDKFVVRLPRSLHAALEAAAEREGSASTSS